MNWCCPCQFHSKPITLEADQAKYFLQFSQNMVLDDLSSAGISVSPFGIPAANGPIAKNPQVAHLGRENSEMPVRPLKPLNPDMPLVIKNLPVSA
jgi:hypothetical protein